MKISKFSSIAALCGAMAVTLQARAEQHSFQPGSIQSINADFYNGTLSFHADESVAGIVVDVRSIEKSYACSLEVSQKGHVLHITLKNKLPIPAINRCHADVMVTMPAGLDVNVKQTKGRSSVEGSFGNVSLSYDVADLSFKGTSREMKAKSRIAKMVFEYESLPEAGKLAVESAIGSIDIRLPADAKAKIESSTNMAQVISEFRSSADAMFSLSVDATVAKVNISRRR